MTQNESFRRKIIYISAIAILLVPLAFISQPATVKKEGTTDGGLLSQMRKEYRLSQAELSDIDPASESMKLATLGLRPVAVTLLWGRVQEAKMKEQWDRLRAATQTLIALQPNFVKVWEYQAHNLSYNISREFDDYQYRYHWVKEGLSYLMTGITYNRKDHRILDQLGFFFGLKLGRSDERSQFRRLYRKDEDYHEKLADNGIETEDIYSRDLGGADNWLTAYRWYDRAITMVENGLPRRTSGLMFYKGAPSQLRNYAIDLEEELRPNDSAREAWQRALEGWVEYGNRELLTSTGVSVYLDRQAEARSEVNRLRGELDKMFPGVRDQMLAARRAQITPEMWEAYNTPMAEITTREFGMLHQTAAQVLEAEHEEEFNQLVEQKVSDGQFEMTPEKRAEFDRLNLEIQLALRDLQFTNTYRGTSNYQYWKERCIAESKDITIQARQALFDARQANQETRFDKQVVRREKRDEKGQVVLDENNQPVIVEEEIPGAIQHYEKSFSLWKDILEEHPELEDDVMEDDLVEAMKEYYGNLIKVQEEWPLDFPLQFLVDRRARRQIPDGLPTTDRELAERLEIQKELEKAREETQKPEDQPESADKPQEPMPADAPAADQKAENKDGDAKPPAQDKPATGRPEPPGPDLDPPPAAAKESNDE